MTGLVGYHKLHALIVDDFENFRSTLYKMLMDIGIGNVDSATTGEEALKACKVRAYDLILCDHNLGKGKSGQQVLEDIRIGSGPCSDSLFILISAENSKSIIMAAYDYEPDAYLTKPITTKALEQRLVRLFEQRHQLKPIYQALKNNNYIEVIKLCKQQIAEGNRYANQCQKILGQTYIKTEHIAEAENLYRSVLDNRELEWAQLGMARTKIIRGDWLGAQQWLESVLHTNPLCMKAYDMQAEIYRAQGASVALQDTLQKATEISPLSILRQQALGEVAQQNNDLMIAINALRRAVKLGEHSSFDKPSVHNQLAHAAIELHATDKELAKPFLREAMKCMTEMEDRFGRSPLVKTRAQFLESQLTLCSGDARRAQELFESARKSLETLDEKESIDAEIEMIRGLRALGQEDEALVQLEKLSRKYAGKQDALEKLDVLQDEPQSEKNKKLVAEINKKGIAAYNAKNYFAAAEAFSIALQNLPNHMGLRLNYVQALIDDLKQAFTDQLNEKVAQTLAKTGVIISPKHPQYRRYRQLQETYAILVKEHGNTNEDKS